MTDGGGVDVILDIMGAAYLDRNIDALATDGQLIVIGMQGGVKAELNLGKLLTKRARVIGTTLRARPVSGPNSKSEIAAAVTASVWPMIAAAESDRSSAPACRSSRPRRHTDCWCRARLTERSC